MKGRHVLLMHGGHALGSRGQSGLLWRVSPSVQTLIYSSCRMCFLQGAVLLLPQTQLPCKVCSGSYSWLGCGSGLQGRLNSFLSLWLGKLQTTLLRRTQPIVQQILSLFFSFPLWRAMRRWLKRILEFCVDMENASGVQKHMLLRFVHLGENSSPVKMWILGSWCFPRLYCALFENAKKAQGQRTQRIKSSSAPPFLRAAVSFFCCFERFSLLPNALFPFGCCPCQICLCPQFDWHLSTPKTSHAFCRSITNPKSCSQLVIPCWSPPPALLLQFPMKYWDLHRSVCRKDQGSVRSMELK